MEDAQEHDQAQQSISQQRLRERPQVKIVRPSNRRKFLVGALGGAAIVAIGSTGWGQLTQNVRIALNTKDYPYHFGDDLSPDNFSSDLNLMAMTKFSEDDSPDAKLYIWNYQQQKMTTLPTGPNYGFPACIFSPDSRYFVYQAHHISDDSTSLDMWDMWTRQKIRTYAGDDYRSFRKIYWSPDGSQIAWLFGDDNTFVVMSSAQLVPLFTFKAPADAGALAWSPDGRKVAFLLDNSDSSNWSVQVWDLQTRTMSVNVTFQSQPAHTQSALLWSPDGKHIAALARGQMRVIQIADTITSYAFKAPGNSTNFAWSPDGRYLAINTWQFEKNFFGTPTTTFDVWDVTKRRIARSYDRGSNDDPHALGWSSNGKRIIVIGALYCQENWDWS